MAPRISPNKTWEGAIAGLFTSVLGAYLANLVYDQQLGSLWLIMLLGLLGGAIGQIGDLVESTMKRFAQVKDSGALFPGHGGLLDRVDGLMYAGPVIWFLLFSFL